MTRGDMARRQMPVTRQLVASDRAAALATFLALTFGWTWGLWAILALWPDAPSPLATPLMLASAFGPSLAGLVTVAVFDGGPGVRRWLKRCMVWRLGSGWYVIATLAPLIAMAVALGLHAAIGGVVPASPATGPLWISFLIVAQILVLGGPLGEEFGWRGYALPALSQHLGWRWASLALGVVWAVWHLPLFWMPGMAQAALPPAPFLAGTVALSVIFARLAVNTGFSVLPAILLHGAINAGSWAIPVTPQGGDLQPYLLVNGILLLTALGCLIKPGPVLATAT
jgi:uncharacterized protein